MSFPSGLAPWLHYHTLDPQGLFQPIAFGFVTERMCAEILAERERILGLTPASRRLKQRLHFAQYDPRRRAEIFQSLLRPFKEEGPSLRAA